MIVLIVVVVVVVALVGVSLALRRRDDTSRRFEDTVASIDADVPAGSVTVRAGEPGAVAVRRRMQWLVTKPRCEEAVEDGVLRLRVKGSPLLSGIVEYELTVPPAVDVTARSRAGSFIAEGVRGRVDLDTNAGAISVTALAGEVRLHSASGAVEGEALTSARVRVSAGAGSVRLQFASAPDEVDVETSVGSIEIVLPSGGYAVDASTAAGAVDVAVDEDPSSSHRVRVRTGAGAIRVLNE